MTTEKFVPPLDVPDRLEDPEGYSHAVWINAVARKGFECGTSRPMPSPKPYGGAIHQPAPRLDIEGWVA
ncbi:hypothetical protein [Corynebacterium variabile]|uniref:hypothetical protein n=1 Tax=Corynebacterium variabile TaxID=1727 RepID=UPI0028AFDEBD|nr:hypothetical protein [Corynebacterium variabile]